MLKRLIAWLLCLAMLGAMVPIGAFAEEADLPAEGAVPETEVTVEETLPETEAPAQEPVQETQGETTLEEPAQEASSDPKAVYAQEDEDYEEDEDYTEEPEGPVDTGTCGEQLTWSLSVDGILTVSGTGAMASYSEEEPAPWYDYSGAMEYLVVEKGVTSIGDYAFYDCGSILSLELPDTLAAIGDYGFAYCYGLTEVSLPKNLETLGRAAFYNCYDLAKISFPKKLQTIGAEAFSECAGLESLSLPDKLRSIGDNAFALCAGLTKVSLGSGVQTIGNSAFLECEALTSVSFPESLRTIGDYAFNACAALTKASFQEGVKSIGMGAFQDCGELTKVSLPKSLTYLGDSAFSGCYNLTSASLKGGLEVIGEEAFAYCELLESISIPKSVKTIGRAAFTDCIGLTELTLQEGLETIGEEAFAYCYSLKSVKFPKTLVTIRDAAFSGCELLTKATMTKSILFLGEGAFDGCYDLTMHVPHGSLTEWYAENNGILYEYTDKCSHGSIGHVEPRDADCDTVGNYEYWFCEKCGTVWEDQEREWLSCLEYVTIPSPHEILYMEYLEPDCETPGNIDYWYCELCQRVWLDEALTVPGDLSQVGLKADHVLQHFDAVAVTCDEDGNPEYWYCQYCEGIWLDQALTQTATEEEVVIPAGHSITHTEEKLPSCEADGNLEYWHCSRCGEYWQDAELNQSASWEDVFLPRDHDLTYGEEVEAGCDREGQLEHWYCPLCGNFWLDGELTQTAQKDQVFQPMRHDLTHTPAVAETCETDGNPEYWYCADCEKYWLDEALTREATMDDLVLAGGHTVQAVAAKEATCQAEGCLAHWHCSRCDGYWLDEALTQSAKKEDVRLPKAHALTHTAAVEVTCEQDGSLEYWHCALCDGYWLDEALTQQTKKEDVFLSGGHLLHNVKERKATCDKPGCIEHWYCQRCEKYWLDEALTKVTDAEAVTLKAAHVPKAVEAREATCQTQGCIAHWGCENCALVWLDEALTQQTTAEAVSLGYAHKLTHWEAKEPTCQEDGNLEHWTCEYCDGCWLDEALTQSTAREQVQLRAGHDTVHVPLLAPTMEESGHLEHWYCRLCGKYWLDAALVRETDKDRVILPSYSDAPENAFLSGSCGDNVIWSLYLLDGTLTLTGSGPMAEYTATAPAPWQEQASQIRSIIVSPGITRIGSYAFRSCVSLESLSLPEGLGSIGEYAFTGCNALEAAVLPEGLTAIGNSAFRNCGKLQSMTLPRSLTKLGSRIFSFCPQLVLTVWPDSAAEGYATDYAISYVYAQEPVCDHASVTHVEAAEPTAQEWGNLEYWICDSCGQRFLDEALTRKVSFEDVMLPPEEEIIRDSRCGEDAYWTFDPASGIVTIIGTGEMYDFNQSLPAPWEAVADMVKAVRVEKGITAIGSRAFRDCTSLKEVTLPAGLVEIGDSAFRDTGIEEVTLPGTVRTLGSHAFRDCTALQTVTLGQGLKTLGARAFAGCASLKNMLLPESLGNMSADIFAGCGLELTVYPDSLAEKYATEYAIPYTYAAQLPQAETLTLLGPDGKNVAGRTLKVDMFANNRLWLFADLGPALSTGKVNWKTSSSLTATVKEGLVTLKQPGRVTITATLADKRISASVALEITYLDEAKTLTAKAAVPKMGLQQGRSAAMEVFGDSPIRADALRFWSSREEIASVNDAGIITATGKSGTATITAAILDDPLNRRVSVKVKVIPTQVDSLVLVPGVEGGQLTQLPDGTQLLSLDQGTLPEDFEIWTLALDDQGKELILSGKSVKWTASNTKVATVSGGKVKLKGQEGKCVITARVDDLVKTEAKLTVQVKNYAPKLEKASLTLNRNRIDGTCVSLTARNGNAIQAVSVHEYDSRSGDYKEALSDRLTADWWGGQLTLKRLKELEKGSVKLLLKVYCENGSTYSYKLKLTVVDEMPSATVKQLEKFNLFYCDSTARLQLSAKDAYVYAAELDFGEDAAFAGSFDPDTGVLTVSYSESYLNGECRLATKGKVRLYLAGYYTPVEKTVTLSTENKAPKLSLSADTSVVNTILGADLVTSFRVEPQIPGMELFVDPGFAQAQVEGNTVKLTLTEPEETRAEIYVNHEDWTDAVVLTHRVKVTKKLPTLTLSSKKGKPGEELTLTLDQSNAIIGEILVEPTSKSAKVLQQANKLSFIGLPGDAPGQLRLHIQAEEEDLPKNGTYEFRITLILKTGQKLSPKTIKVTIK